MNDGIGLMMSPFCLSDVDTIQYTGNNQISTTRVTETFPIHFAHGGVPARFIDVPPDLYATDAGLAAAKRST
jgi:hypothetical protein